MEVAEEVESIETIKQRLELLRPYYLEVLTGVKSLLERFKNTAEGQRAIYRITSRKDYQEDELKTPKSVQGKLIKRRSELEKKGTKNPKKSYGITKMDDIVGLTVICVYPADVRKVADYLESLKGKSLAYCRKEHVVGKVDARKKDGTIEPMESGYKGLHFTVSLAGNLSRYKCEVRVITMLDETWAYKVHDLIYKPKSVVKENYAKQARMLSDHLRSVDNQCEWLETEIRKKELEEIERRAICSLALFNQLSKKVGRLRKLRDTIIADENKERIRHGDISDIIDRINNVKDVNRNLCRIACLLVTKRAGHDADGCALRILDEYISNAANDHDRHWGHLLKSRLLWALGNELAIEEAEEALRCHEKCGCQEDIGWAKGDVAYFIADFEKYDKENVAREYSLEIKDLIPAHLDTYGYVKIMFGKSYEEVKEGLELCEKACEQDEDKELAEVFLRIHRHKALDRMLEFSEVKLEEMLKQVC